MELASDEDKFDGGGMMGGGRGLCWLCRGFGKANEGEGRFVRGQRGGGKGRECGLGGTRRKWGNCVRYKRKRQLCLQDCTCVLLSGLCVSEDG